MENIEPKNMNKCPRCYRKVAKHRKSLFRIGWIMRKGRTYPNRLNQYYCPDCNIWFTNSPKYNLLDIENEPKETR